MKPLFALNTFYNWSMTLVGWAFPGTETLNLISFAATKRHPIAQISTNCFIKEDVITYLHSMVQLTFITPPTVLLTFYIFLLLSFIIFPVISHSPLSKPVWELVRTASPFIYHFSLINHFATFRGHITTTKLCDYITAH